jgi:hypothetical protein
MSFVRTSICGPGLTTVVFAALGAVAMGGNLVQNGSFSSSTYTSNNEFDQTYGGQGVTGWMGTGYDIYFVAGTATTVSANNQWGSTTEKLPTTFSTAGDKDGGNFVALDGDPTINSTVSQSISGLTAGTFYDVSFYWAATELVSRNGATTEQLKVTLGTSSAETVLENTPGQGFEGWFQQSFRFKATSSTEALTFLAVGTPAGLPPLLLLDGVSVTTSPAPEPATITMFGVGTALILVAGNWRRRHRRS